jgi:hypothetical protein
MSWWKYSIVIIIVSLFSLKTSAQLIYPPSYQGRFQEPVVFSFTNSNQISGYTTTDHKAFTSSQSLPPNTSFSNGTLTINSKGTVIIDNPAKAEPFYKISVTIQDRNQTQLFAYITGIDAIWSYSSPTQGFSAGIGGIGSTQRKTYWWDHTQLTPFTQLGTSEQTFTSQTWNNFNFLKRKSQDVKIDIYVTPNGTYPVINGSNYGSFPDMYSGSYTYRGNRPNYIVLGKWDTGPEAAVFTNLTITRLDNQIQSFHDINAHFIKKAVESPEFETLVSNSTQFSNGSSGYGIAIWTAFLYKAYDYYFGTDHTSRIQELYDFFLTYYAQKVAASVSQYGVGETIHINHDLMNTTQSYPLVTWALSGSLRPDQLTTVQKLFAQTIDASQAYIKTDGSFPFTIAYQNDTFAEEVSWILVFYGGYTVLFPSDQPRVNKTLDYLKFLGFHHATKNESLTQVHGTNIRFRYLNNAYKTFTSQYIWPGGELDNHNFHPSINYAGVFGSAAIVNNALIRTGFALAPNTLMHNMDLVYNTSFHSRMNYSTLRAKSYGLSGTAPNWVVNHDYITLNSEGLLTDYVGYTKPSLLEDWTTTWTSYSLTEEYGDYPTADIFSRNVYYSHYPGTGKLFCGHAVEGARCEAGSSNFYNYQFPQAIYSLLNSRRSPYVEQKIPSRGPVPLSTTATINRACTMSTRAIYQDKTNVSSELVSIGSDLFYRNNNDGWWQDSILTSWRYNSNPNAPCYNKSSCSFTTHFFYYDRSNKFSESITVGNEFYNWTEGTGWWGIDHSLKSIARYSENAHAPCYSLSAENCRFTTRSYSGVAGSSTYNEYITVGSKYYEYNSGSGWVALNNHDLSAITHFSASANAPCYGKALGTCVLTVANRYTDNNGNAAETYNIGDRYFNYTSGTGWWPITDNRLGYTNRFLEENGPCYTYTTNWTATPTPQPSATTAPTNTPNPDALDIDRDYDFDMIDVIGVIRTWFSASRTIFDFNRLVSRL